MPLRILPLILLCFCLLSGPARALDPGKDFRHYVRNTWTTQDGLPQSSVTAFAQTADGYLWVGTQAGLARFDGAGFTTFSPANEPALPHKEVMALLVDDDGALWIATVAGMAVLRDGRFSDVPWTGAGDRPRIFRMQRAAGGRILVATSLGAAHVVDGRLQPLQGWKNILSVAMTADGDVWTGYAGGVRRWDGRNWHDTAWPEGPAPVISDLIDVDGQLWAATSAGFHAHGPDGWRQVPGTGGPDAMWLTFAYRDRDGNVWGGGDVGLVRVRPDGSVETVAATDANGLSNLTTAFEDREGNLWLGSLTHGMSRAWTGWTRRFSTGDGLQTSTAWTVAADAGGDGIWVGTNNGVAHLDRRGRFTPVPGSQDASGSAFSLMSEPGRVWIGLFRDLAVYEPGSGRPPTVPDWARGQTGMVSTFTRDADGHLWLGTMSSLLRWDGSKLERFDEARGLAAPLAERGLIILRDGRRLAMTTTGLFELDGDRFVPAPEGHGLPEDTRLLAFAELSDGRMLIATEDDRLLLRHRDRWHGPSQADGLPRGTVYQMVEHDGAMWIAVSETEGVYRLPLEELTAFVEGRIDWVRPDILVNEPGIPNGGLQAVCCNGVVGANKALVTGETLWVPTSDGVLAIDIDDIVRNPLPPAVQLGRVQVDEQWRTLEPGSAALDADQRDLTLAFDVLSFQDPRSNQARYRLAGYDREWKTAASMVREVRYTNLPPGDYAFEVMASNNAGVWTAQPARLEFGIRPYFHETAAFRLLLVALALLLVYAGYRTQRYRYRMRQAHLERLVDERTEALAQSNQDLARSNDQLADSNRQLEQASLTDPLTGLRNRRYLTQQIPADLSFYDRQLTSLHSDTVVFAMLDLDHFKQVNDVYGHATGDRVLEEAARRLRALVRAGDYVVRWGGEEFLLVFRPMPSAHVTMMGERLRGVMAESVFDIGEDRSIRLTASVGLSEYPLFRTAGQPLSWEEMIELADQAAYHVKRNGRDGWALFRPTDSTRMQTLLSDLQRDPQALLRAGALEVLGSIAGRPGRPAQDRDTTHGTGDGEAGTAEDRHAAAADT